MTGQEAVIEQMPEDWSEEGERKAPEQAGRYKELQQKLVELNERRKAAREKVENYKALKQMVDLLGEDGGVQDNLVTKNGEVEVELEKMRRLMVRVERGIGGLEERQEDDMVIDGEEGHTNILNLLGQRA
jgi:predicted  nucleic acid-binding Zn-ribbon protein